LVWAVVGLGSETAKGLVTLVVDKWLEDNNFQGNGHNWCDIGPA
jgi:hypothetical protein